jgi:hypothetical protein
MNPGGPPSLSGGHAMLPNITGLETAVAGGLHGDILQPYHDADAAIRMLNQLKEGSTLPGVRVATGVTGSTPGTLNTGLNVHSSHPAMHASAAGRAVRSDSHQNAQTAAQSKTSNKAAMAAAASAASEEASGEEVRRRNDRNKKRRKRSRIADLVKWVRHLKPPPPPHSLCPSSRGAKKSHGDDQIQLLTLFFCKLSLCSWMGASARHRSSDR